MTVMHFTELEENADIQILPSGYCTGLVLFGSLWLVPVITLVALAHGT